MLNKHHEIKIEAGAPDKTILEEVSDEIHSENFNKKVENVFQQKRENSKTLIGSHG